MLKLLSFTLVVIICYALKAEITLKAKTPYTETLKRWILGFGDQVTVMGPANLKKEIKAIHKRSL